MRSISPTAKNTSAGKVYVGLSGGVDSAVAAAMLKKEGYDVTGVFIRIALAGYPCTAGEDKLEAMRVAAHLRIPFLSIDLSREYKRRVFDVSLREFAAGRTPNPDALCNREIKFGLFFDWCMARGASYVATGHYAQAKEGLLYMSLDKEKDQSYFLWAVSETKLRKTLFPVGHLRKAEVRALARSFGLPNAERKDSQGLCFLGPISIGEMLRRELALAPGAVLGESGEVLGTHIGAPAYTLGQRHGFSLAVRSPLTAPHYVVDKDAAANTITVSSRRLPQGARATTVTLRDTQWIGDIGEGECRARYRYRQKLIPAEYRGPFSIFLLEPHYVPAGQSLVLYRDTRCLGGGVVDTAHPAAL